MSKDSNWRLCDSKQGTTDPPNSLCTAAPNFAQLIVCAQRNLKYDTNEPTYERETDSQTENRLVVAKGVGRDGVGVWD